MAFWREPAFKRAKAETPLFPVSSPGQMTSMVIGAIVGGPGLFALSDTVAGWQKILVPTVGALLGLGMAWAARFLVNWIRAPYAFWGEETALRVAAEKAREKAIHDLRFEQNLRSLELSDLSRVHAQLNVLGEENNRLQGIVEQTEKKAREHSDIVGRLKAKTLRGRDGVTVDAAQMLSELADGLATGLNRFWISDAMKKRLGVPSTDSVVTSLVATWALDGLVEASNNADQFPPYVLTEVGRSVVHAIRASL